MSTSVKIYAAYKIGIFEQNLDPANQNLPASRIPCQGNGTLCPQNILKSPASSWGAIMGDGNLPDLLLATTF